jgi:hypothetical protein
VATAATRATTALPATSAATTGLTLSLSLGLLHLLSLLLSLLLHLLERLSKGASLLLSHSSGFLHSGSALSTTFDRCADTFGNAISSSCHFIYNAYKKIFSKGKKY